MDIKEVLEAAKALEKAVKENPNILADLEKAKKMKVNPKEKGVHKPLESDAGQSIAGALTRLGEEEGAKKEVARVTEEQKKIKPKLNKEELDKGVHPTTDQKGVSPVGAMVRAARYLRSRNYTASRVLVDHAKKQVKESLSQGGKPEETKKSQSFSVEMLNDTLVKSLQKSDKTEKPCGCTLEKKCAKCERSAMVKAALAEDYKPMFYKKAEIGSGTAGAANKIIKPSDVSDAGKAGFKVKVPSPDKGVKVTDIPDPKGLARDTDKKTT